MGHRDELLAAARRLLERQGYAHITARDLVAESGTNLASIGYHFGSKAALLNAALEASFDDWTHQLAQLVMADPAATPLERAGATWVTVVDRFDERRPILQSYVEALAQALRAPELREQLADHYDRARSLVAGLVARSLDDGSTAADPRCRAVATLVIAACDGLAMQYLLDPDRAPNAEELAEGLLLVLEAPVPASAPPPAAEGVPQPPAMSRTAGRTSAR